MRDALKVDASRAPPFEAEALRLLCKVGPWTLNCFHLKPRHSELESPNLKTRLPFVEAELLPAEAMLEATLQRGHSRLISSVRP